MASVKDTAYFFAHGNSKQFEYVLDLYTQALKLKAEKKNKKPEDLIRLDDWFQKELPSRIQKRGKDRHIIHEELVQTMKWKQSRGKFYPQLSFLIKVNTPRAVVQETKKAFKKLPNVEQAIAALSNLKGVGITMASAILAAAAPECAPFMADECLLAIPEIEGIDYTQKEYLKFVKIIQTTVDRLNSEPESNNKWTPHRVELSLWTHSVASEYQPDLLTDLLEVNSNNCNNHQTGTNGVTITTTTSGSTLTSEETTIEQSDESNLEPAILQKSPAINGVLDDGLDESSTRSEDSLEKPILPIAVNHNHLNNAEITDSDSQSSAKRSLQCSEGEQTEITDEPETKKIKNDD